MSIAYWTKVLEASEAAILEFGFRQPIVVDSDMVIVVGHTRCLACVADLASFDHATHQWSYPVSIGHSCCRFLLRTLASFTLIR